MAKARKRTRRRSSRNFVAIPFTKNLLLATLANATVLTVPVTAGLTEDLYVISCDLSATFIGLTAGEGDPMQIGLAHGDYGVTEIKENLEVAITGPGDKINQERTRRLVRRTGMLQAQGTNVHTEMSMIGRNGSRIVRTTCKFVVQNPSTLQAWIQNRSGAALTTGSTLVLNGTVFGRWIL